MKPHAGRQEQFLEVISRDEAAARFEKHLRLAPVGIETVPLAAALGRVLAEDVISQVDVTSFDRSNVDGFAVQAADTFGAMEEQPRMLQLNQEILAPGMQPAEEVRPGTATTIATGAMIPRGADAVIMVEETELLETEEGHQLEIRRAVSPGQAISFAGTDVARGETVLREGLVLTSREIGVLAAIGRTEVAVCRRPKVGIISTGNEIIPPGQPLKPGAVYDSNAAILAAAVTELGGEPIVLGCVPDEETELRKLVCEGLQYDMLLLSGGTSKGAGDLSYRVISELNDPGIVAHGVALKPGKPICLAVTGTTPVVILPGFPTSAIFTFHEFVAPVLRRFAGLGESTRPTVPATLPMKIHSERGRTEYLLVNLVRQPQGFTAYPLGKGSGSVTTFSYADGFLTIGQQTEFLDAGSSVTVHLLGQKLEPADLVIIGSHCVGLDVLIRGLHQRGLRSKALHVGSMGGVTAARRGECDIAGIHLMDPQTGSYNQPYVTPELELVPGYRRMQGLVFRKGDARFEHRTLEEILQAVPALPDCTMVNRNAGSGTRILIDQLLAGKRPAGYAVQSKSHNAVAAAIQQHRADWGVAIETVAKMYDLGFLPIQEEHYDFLIPKSRLQRDAVQQFLSLLQSESIREKLQEMGFQLPENKP